MTIVSWGRRARYKFMSLGELANVTPPNMSAVYAITYKQDGEGKPKSHTVFYFGEAEDLSRDVAAVQDGITDLWLTGGGEPDDDLYVFAYPMPGSTRRQRSSVKDQLISEYGPKANLSRLEI